MIENSCALRSCGQRSIMKGLLLVLLSALLAIPCAAETVKATVYISRTDNSLRLVRGVLDKENGPVYGVYEEGQDTTGWDVLKIVAGYNSTQHYSDHELMRSAGYAEGALTQSQIWDQYQNLYKVLLSEYTQQEIEEVKQFFQTQREWMEGRITDDSEFWYTVGLIYSQFQGLMEGYNSVALNNYKLDIFAFDLLNGVGDFIDISNFLFSYRRPDVHNLTRSQPKSMLYRNGHCSALIKVLPGFENIFASHSSWFTYSSMYRIYKYYYFNMSGIQLPTKVVSFSSYPGFLESLDDFYIMDSGLVMLQTTNNIFNKTLYDSATDKALLAWQRVRLANWLASDGKQWAFLLAQFNSGTYNNQYMVLDLNRVHLNHSIDNGALWVVEQIPGYVASGDETEILRDGYWASYNVPFFEKVYNMSGYPEMAKKVGTDVSYQLCPRAKIFRRDQGNVKDMSSMQYIMRYNDYMNDPYSEKNPMNTICSRGDLLEKPEAGGCYDTKVTDYFMAMNMTALAENGPTHQGLPPFSWSKSGLTDPHLGQPDTFDFGFVKMTPEVP